MTPSIPPRTKDKTSRKANAGSTLQIPGHHRQFDDNTRATYVVLYLHYITSDMWEDHSSIRHSADFYELSNNEKPGNSVELAQVFVLLTFDTEIRGLLILEIRDLIITVLCSFYMETIRKYSFYLRGSL